MQKGGSQYGFPPPEMATFGTASVARPPMAVNIKTADASSPRQPVAPRQSNFEELATTVTGSYPEEDPLAGGDEVERGVSGNRWPRRETVALLKIRSDMDSTFRDATLKGPLWEEVSRKLAEQGYTRSAKKCKEKFENVHKYYKRTKDSRASRPDGKSYRFFSQLEALHNASSSSSAAAAANSTAVSTAITNTATAAANLATTLAMTGAQIQQPSPISSIPPAPPPSAASPVPPIGPPAATAGASLSALGAGVSFSSNTSESESETEDEDTEEGPREQRKRKREGGGRGGRSKKMVAFFEGLMKQVIERQEAMQQKFLETIERREQDRMIREEAWRRQEMARLSREQEAMAQERVNAASRDATIISFLQKITGQTIHLPQTVPVQAVPSPQSAAVVQTAPAPPPQPAPTPSPTPPQSQTQSQPQSQPQSHLQLQQQPPQPQPHLQLQQQQPPQPQPQPQSQLHPQQQPRQPQQTPSPRQHPQPESAKPSPIEMGPTVPQEMQQQQVPQETETQALVTASGSEPASSRWPKAEVHALINIRAGMESRYQEAGPKGPLWEEISAAMKQLGYGRNAKRCKEKWENINKYFKKVKESNRKRPEDAKTCPYFHQLDALYRNKVLGGGGGGGDGRSQQQDPDPNVLPITTLPPPSTTGEGASSKSIVKPKGAPASGQARSSNGGLPPPTSFVQDANTTATELMKKPEDIVKELMEQRHHHQYDYDRMGEDTEDDEDEDDDGMDEEEQKMAYKIEFQRRSMPSTSTSNANGNKAAAARTASPTGSFFAMVQQ